MKRISILGGTGMAGHVAALYLRKKGYDVHYMSRSAETSDKSTPITVENLETAKKWLEKTNPNIVLNCLGLLQQECDNSPEKAILINALLPNYLAHIYKNANVKVIHLSSDCVFSGDRGQYTENDFPDGESVYARTKFLGEIKGDKDLTFRTSIIGPDINKHGIGLFNWFMNQSGKVNGYVNAVWNGVTTIELAKAIHAAIEQNLTGLYQLASPGTIDKCSLLQLFKNAFNKTDIEILPYEQYKTNKSLLNTREGFLYEVKPLDRQIDEMKRWIDENKELYPHY